MKRCIRIASIGSVSLLYSCSCNAMVAPTTARAKRRVSLPRSVSEIMPKSEGRSILEESYYDSVDDIGFEVNAFQELQNSVNSDILDEGLQTQIDQATGHPEQFLDAHVSDATYMEKVAMSSIPQQLPRPALKALSQQQAKRTKSTTSTTKLDRSMAKVTPEEEIELAKMIQKGVKLHKVRAEFEEENDRKPTRSEWSKAAGLPSVNALRKEVASYRRAKQLLVSANVGLVHAVVKPQYTSLQKNTGMTYEEFVQEGSLGLIRAAELFDPGRGLRFSTYATIWIKGALSNSHMQQPITVPHRERAKFNKIQKTEKELTNAHGGEAPSIEEVADSLGMTVAEIMNTKRRFLSTKQVLSLDYQTSAHSRGGGETSTWNQLETDKNFQADADLAQRTEIQADVLAALARNLNAREARLMRLRYGLADGRTRTIRECAEAMGLGQSATQNLASRTLQKLRKAEELDSLEEYFLTIA